MTGPRVQPPAGGPRLVSIEEARRTLGVLVDAAAAGQTVILTRHGAPIAALTPYPAGDGASTAPALGMTRLDFMKRYRAEVGGDRLNTWRLAREWSDYAVLLGAGGRALSPEEAAEWAKLGYMPGEAFAAIRAGVTIAQARTDNALANYRHQIEERGDR